MRSFFIASVMGLSLIIMGVYGPQEAFAQQPNTHAPSESQNVPLPKDGEIINKDLKIASCKRRAQLAGKDNPVYAQKCKKSLGQEVCEQFYTVKACASNKG